MAYRPHARASVDVEAPRSWATCDRCGLLYNLANLNWQYDWRGQSLVNLNLLVCDRCLDIPSPWYRAIAFPPDPAPIVNARAEPYTVDEAGGYAETTMTWYNYAELFCWGGIQITWG
jgi:hypothetical protein